MSIIRQAGAALLVGTGLAATLALTAGSAAAAPDPAPRGAPYPKASLCVDQAGALGSRTCARIATVLRADEAASSDEIAVAVVRSTGGVPIETWGTGLFNAWGVGKRDKNNGVLLVVAVADRRLRIVTGSGLKTRLSDSEASEIVGGTITPLLRGGRTEDAVLAGLDAIRRGLDHRLTAANTLAPPGTVGLVDRNAGAPDYRTDTEGSGSGGSRTWPLFLLLAVIAGVGFVIRLVRSGSGGGYADDGEPSYRRRSSYRSFRSGGSRSSGSSRSRGFGGGRSSGGGASGSW